MKVLIACEESQTVCKAFRALNHEAYSCDLQECSGGRPEWHIKDDAIKILYSDSWDLVVAHPPCKRLANSGVRWLNERDLWEELKESISFFNAFRDYGRAGNKIALENSIPHKYAMAGIGDNYTQIIHPWQFGHLEQKATCLWLYNLPKLKETNNVKEEMKKLSKSERQRVHFCSPGKDRAKLRSKTYPGIAQAMAMQWGGPPFFFSRELSDAKTESV